MKRYLRRARSRGVSSISNVLESAMVMGWFVALLVGERAVSSAADARRKAESAASESATSSSAQNCTAKQPSVAAGANASPSVGNAGKPDVASAISLVQGLGLGGERTFPNYTQQMKSVKVKATASPDGVVGGEPILDGKQFEGERALGCTEKSLDVPKGTLEDYRQKLWTKNLQGY